MTISEAFRVLFDEEHLGEFAGHVRNRITDPNWTGSTWDHPRVIRAQQAITALETHRLVLAHFLEMVLAGEDPPAPGHLVRDPVFSVAPADGDEMVEITNPGTVTMTATQSGVFEVHVPPAHTICVNGTPIDQWPSGTLREVLKTTIAPNIEDARYMLNLRAGDRVTVKRHDVH